MAGLLEANGIYNVKLLVNRVRPDMIQKVRGGDRALPVRV